MHREYRPADLNDLRAQAFGGGDPHHHHHDHDHHGHAHDDQDHHHHDDRGLYVLTTVLGLLLAGELLFGWLGWERWRAPGGVSLALIAAVIGGVRIVYGALEALLHGSIGADVALAQACIAALVIGQPFVAAEVVFIALVGEVLEAVTFGRAQRAIHRLLDQAPATARVRRDGHEVEVPAAQVLVGDLVIVRPGERVPVDGPVVVGRSTVDQSALTGEPIAVDKGPGEPVYSGTINQFGLIEVKAEKVGHETTLGQVFRLVAEAQKRKSPLERTADRLARYFLPVVETVAGLTLLAGWWFGWPDVWLRAVAVLVVACPCALILATPAAVLASLAWLARHGVLIKGGVALERLAACDTFAFDKTGTLTFGRPELASAVPFGDTPEAELVALAASAEGSSPHPLARAVVEAARHRGVALKPILEAVALPGAGVAATLADGDGPGLAVLVGNRRFMTERGVGVDDDAGQALEVLDGRGETPLLVAVNGRLVGALGARDTVRPEAHDVVHDLKHLKIGEIAILTGDRAAAARVVAKRTHVKTVEAELLPADKARWVTEAQARGRRVAVVGDGINDAPALAAAHVGIALGGIGADLAREAGDMVVLGEPLRVLPDLVRLSRATVAVIRQNIVVFAFGLNAVAMASAALGVLGPVPAALLHQAGSLLVLLNAMRLLAFGDWGSLPPVRWLSATGEAVRRFDDRLDPGFALFRVLSHWRTGLRALAVVGSGAYAASGVTAVGPDEVGLVRRFGRHVATLPPGLHVRLPAPFESVTRLAPARVQSLEVGFRTGGPGLGAGLAWGSGHNRNVTARAEDEALLLTGDGQYVEMAAAAQYRLGTRPADWRSFAFSARDPDEALRPLAESAVREVVGRSALDALLTSGRRDAEAAAARLLQRRADAYGLGVEITGVAFQDVHPPVAVVDAYRDVSRAGGDRQRRGNEGRTYLAETVAAARGKAAAVVNRAEARRKTATERAAGAADAFRALAAVRETRPDLTDANLYWDALASALAGRPKVVIDGDRTRTRHLILTDRPGTFDLPALVGPPRPDPTPTAGSPAP